MSALDHARETVLGGMRIAVLDRGDMAAALRDDASHRDRTGPPRLVSATNGHVIHLFGRDRKFREVMGQMDVVNADGMPLVHLSRFFGEHPLPGRVATTDFFHDAAEVACREGLSFYLLGADEEENRRAERAVRRIYPGLRIAGRHSGYFDPTDEASIVEDIRRSGTDVLWVGLGVPREQEFLARNKAHLTGLLWAVSCGGLFNFLSGTRSRAPEWMQQLGMEWAFRLMLEPRRLARRYAVSNITALYHIAVEPTLRSLGLRLRH